MHPFLMSQHIEYRIFVVEPLPKSIDFNRGLVKNVGFIEAGGVAEQPPFDCYIFNDVSRFMLVKTLDRIIVPICRGLIMWPLRASMAHFQGNTNWLLLVTPCSIAVAPLA